jgi:hypothetical protein
MKPLTREWIEKAEADFATHGENVACESTRIMTLFAFTATSA